jgi:hypothetical protein
MYAAKHPAYRMRDIVPTNPQQNGATNVTQIMMDRNNQLFKQSTNKLLSGNGNQGGLAVAA